MKCPGWANSQRWKGGQWLPGDGMGRKQGETANGYKVLAGSDEKFLQLDNNNHGYTTLNIH